MAKVKKARQQYPYDPDYVTEPGDILQETIDGLGISQKELAARTDFTPKHINQLISGVKRISPETALRLEKVTGVPARFWNNLESNYQERKARLADSHSSAADLAWLKTIPTAELVKRNAIKGSDDSTDMLQETLTFFRVASVDAWNKGWSHHQIAFRKSGSKTDCTGKIAAWVRLAEVKAESIECASFDVKKFKSAISELRLLVDSEPQIFVPAMQEQCAAAGVALALVQELPGGHVSGAAKWLSSTKAMIALNLRGKALDKFWFTFFHEAGHILNDSRDQVFVDVDYADDPRELKANKFARDVLIPPEHEAALSGLRTEAAVRTFARNIKVHPSIVVGRLQREKIVPYNRMKSLMARLDWAVE